MGKVLIVGGGASGMFAAAAAAENGHEVHVFEKNNKLGMKLFITGKGRCNLTNACDMDELFQNIVTNPKFMYRALYGFSNWDAIAYFEGLGLKTKIERGNRVFPESDHSSDVIKALSQRLLQLGVHIHLGTAVSRVIAENGQVCGLITKKGERVDGCCCFIATGGLSYASTGSSGDGYRFAKESGHTVTKLFPSLVPVHIGEEWVKSLQGLSLKNVALTACAEQGSSFKTIYQDFGEMLFTHYGVSGPIILSTSSYLIPFLSKGDQVCLMLDLKPALSEGQLDSRILRDFEEAKNKQLKNSLDHLLPQRLIGPIIELSGIDPDRKVNSVTKEERAKLVHILKNLKMTVLRLGSYQEAVITRGGVSVKEINPATMGSRLVKGLYFIGEVLDVDALTGGFNLQIAWSTAYLAAKSLQFPNE